MIKEQFCSYEIALKLKELDFDEKCFALYDAYQDNKLVYLNEDGRNAAGLIKTNASMDNSCLAPLWQQVIDWLRDKHSLDVIISSNLLGYGFIIYNRYPPKNILDNRVFQTYFEAREQAIFKALELIK